MLGVSVRYTVSSEFFDRVTAGPATVTVTFGSTLDCLAAVDFGAPCEDFKPHQNENFAGCCPSANHQ